MMFLFLLIIYTKFVAKQDINMHMNNAHSSFIRSYFRTNSSI